MAQVSPHAIVEPAGQLAEGVRVGAFTYIGPEVRVGPGCVIGNNVTLTGRTTLGANTRVHPLAVVGAAPPGATSPGACIIGRDNAIREQVTIYAGRDEAHPTRIGDENLIMIAGQVGAGVRIEDHGIFANCTVLEPAAHLEEYVRNSAFSVVQAGVRVGAYTFVAGYAMVDHDAPPYAMIQGCPYRIRGVNTHNLTRCGFAEEDIRALKNAFRELFDPVAGYADAEALERLSQAEQGSDHVNRLLQALRPNAGRKAGPGP